MGALMWALTVMGVLGALILLEEGRALLGGALLVVVCWLAERYVLAQEKRRT